jgi:hypothetical protein
MNIEFIYAACLTIIVVHSEVFRWLRNLVAKFSDKMGYLIHCPMCFGFWAGAFWALSTGGDIFLQALLTSVSSWIIYSVVTAFDALGDYFIKLSNDGDLNL